MNELIKLNQSAINGEVQQTVNARELHQFLEVGRDFSNWIKGRISKYGFEENEDYVVVENLSFPDSGNAKARPQTLKEYYLTLDVAKHLAMMEKNEKGLQIRQYFIECSNKADKILQVMSHLEYQPKTPYLFLDGNEYKTDSLTLSKITNKHHFHIIRDIEEEILTLEENPNLDAPTKEYGLYYLNKSQHSDKQVEHFRYFESAIDKFKAILGDE